MDLVLPVAFLGLPAVGKTSIVRSVVNNTNEIYPTAGMEINYITTTSKTLLVYDCSGEGSSRANWQLIGQHVDCIVYVIDAHNTATFRLAKKHLFLFLQKNKYMKKKNLCIMLNKCDLKNRPLKQLLVRALQVEKISKLINKLYIKETSAYNKEGLDESLEWIIKNATFETIQKAD